MLAEQDLLQAWHRKWIRFERYFDPRVFRTIENNPELLDIRTQTLTITFWDIRGFSLLCEALKAHPTLISGFLQEYFQTAAQVIFQHHGVLDKFIGDGVMGLFGAFNHKDDEGRQDAGNALHAAGALKERFDTLLERWLDLWKLYTPQAIDVGLACGIHTGAEGPVHGPWPQREFCPAVGGPRRKGADLGVGVYAREGQSRFSLRRRGVDRQHKKRPRRVPDILARPPEIGRLPWECRGRR